MSNNKPYAPITIEITDELLRGRMRQHHAVLQVLANRSDEMGLSWCSTRYIANLAGYAEQSVQAVIEDFIERGWLREQWIADQFSGRQKRYWQLSPDVIFIRKELQERAWEIWHDCNKSGRIVTKDSQPESTSRIQPNQPNQPNQQKPAAAPESARENRGADNTPGGVLLPPPPPPPIEQPMPAPIGAEPQRRQAQQTASRSDAAKNPSPGSAPPPPQTELTPEKEPLTAELERLAHEVVAHAPTRISQARALVNRVGPDGIRAGLEQLKGAKKRGSVKNPYGLLYSWFVQGAVDAKADLPPRVDRYEVFGEYADYIKFPNEPSRNGEQTHD